MYKEKGTFETAIVTYGKVVVDGNTILISGETERLKITFDDAILNIGITVLEEVVVGDHNITVYPLRVSFALKEKTISKKIKLLINALN